ncbi:unnamed protein product, partial [Brassica oleracea var. botrytis]
SAFVKRSISSVQSASSLSFSSLVFSSPSRREAATKQRVTNRLLTVKSASGKTYSQFSSGDRTQTPHFLGIEIICSQEEEQKNEGEARVIEWCECFRSKHVYGITSSV